MEELQQISEIKEIHVAERTAAIIEYHDEQLEIPIIPITPDNQEEILKTLPVDWTYETLVKQDAMVILGKSVQGRSLSYLSVNRRKSVIAMVRWFGT